MSPEQIIEVSESIKKQIDAALQKEKLTPDMLQFQLANSENLITIANKKPRVFIEYTEHNREDLIKIFSWTLNSVGIQPDQYNIKEQKGETICFYIY